MSTQQTTADDNDKTEKLFEMINDIRTGMLVTQRSDGSLCSRPMATHTTDSDHCLWFLTDNDSAKTLEITSQPQVNVSFADPDDQNYVSVSGTASIVEDEAKLDEVWNKFAEAWYPEGKEDPRLTLIRVEIAHAEYWDAPSSTFVNLFRVAKALVTGERPAN